MHGVYVWDRLKLSFFEDDSFSDRISRHLFGPAEPEGRPAKLTRLFRL